MKRIILTAALTVGLLGPTSQIQAEDIDLYAIAGDGVVDLPNVLIAIDNSANWNARVDGVDVDGDDKSSKKEIEHFVLNDIFASGQYRDAMQVGIMSFAKSNQPRGGKIVKAVRELDADYEAELARLFDLNDGSQTLGGTNDESGNKKNQKDKTNNAPYALSLNEAYRYFAGLKPRSGTNDGTHDPDAVSNGTYVSPAQANECGSNFVILIGNGRPDSGEDNDAQSVLEEYNARLRSDPIEVSPDKYESNWADEYARFMANTDITPDDEQNQQSVTTYVIDVHDDETTKEKRSDESAHAWLESIARAGKGGYYAVRGPEELKDAIADILDELQAVNSVFAATTLPVSVNVRGTNLNQVYMGQFRPNKQNNPRWAGNLKLYELDADPDTGDVFLVDKESRPIQSPANGFIVDSAVSFWTEDEDEDDPGFWEFAPSGRPLSASDSPDGPVVEKGATAQRLRERDDGTGYAAERTLYTCIDCGPSDSLAPFDTSNTAIPLDAALINWVLGEDNSEDEDLDGLSNDVRASIHGDVLHSTPAVVNYNDTGDDSVIMVYYGANDGVIHAVQGGKNTSLGDGEELWGFVPEEFFGDLHLLRDNNPSGKPYFADGSIGVYTEDGDDDGRLDGSSDKVYLYVTMRRGGRFIYALDVTDRENPELLWQRDFEDSGYGELGQSWSKPVVATVDTASGARPVLVFGAGYDAPADDADGASGHTMGRGIFVADAETGDVIWQAGPETGAGGSGEYAQVPGMTYSIPSDVTVIDRNDDGFDDRLYVGDTGGNVWRVDIAEPDPIDWAVSKLASVGDAAGLANRKFLFPPDVVYGDDSSGAFDAVLIGSGDRTDPLEPSVANRFYMFKDRATGLSADGVVTLNEGDLFDATANTIQEGATDSERQQASQTLDSEDGWYVTLSFAGEKVTGNAVTLNEATFFNTFSPPPTDSASPNCAPLGTSRFYVVNYKDATTRFENDGENSVLGEGGRFKEGKGGGFPPSPVPVIVEIDGKKYQAVISGTEAQEPPGTQLGARHRVYWFKEMD